MNAEVREATDEQTADFTQRSLRSRQVTGAFERHAGAGASDADAKGARPAGGAEHGGLCHRLSRLASWRGRSEHGSRGKDPRRQRHPVPARTERGSCRHRDLGFAAGGAAGRGEIRRRLRALVRQGAGGGPVRRCDAPCEHGGHLAQWRRPDGDGRRPYRRKLHDAASIRLGDDRRLHAGRQPCRCAGDPRLRPLRLGAFSVSRVSGSGSRP